MYLCSRHLKEVSGIYSCQENSQVLTDTFIVWNCNRPAWVSLGLCLSAACYCSMGLTGERVFLILFVSFRIVTVWLSLHTWTLQMSSIYCKKTLSGCMGIMGERLFLRPQILSWIEVWALTWPLLNINIVLLNRVCVCLYEWSFGCVLEVTVLLEKKR